MGKKAQSLPRHISLGVTDLRDRPVVIEGHLARESGVAETVGKRGGGGDCALARPCLRSSQ